jgi:hypothetical protein
MDRKSISNKEMLFSFLIDFSRLFSPQIGVHSVLVVVKVGPVSRNFGKGLARE